MLLRTLSLALALVALAGCADTAQRAIQAPQIESAPPAPVAREMNPQMQFAQCQALVLTSEDLAIDPGSSSEEALIRHAIVAEVPSTPRERRLGLQGRRDLHPKTAMLLSFDGEHNPVLWMKDTPASLDLVFFDAAGMAFHLEAGTTPNSTRFLTPEEPDPVATHVLHLPAGTAENLGLFPGYTRIDIGQVEPCAAYRSGQGLA